MGRHTATAQRHTTFLGRLARDARGNTLAIMAAALIPLIGFSGSAVDMARLYVVKARLQQACDAGVLAGRAAMTDTTPPPSGSTTAPLDTAAAAQAQTFFANNFRGGWFQNTNAVFSPVKTLQGSTTVANAVYATAKADVPMALMRYFGSPTVTLNVTCQALKDLADTDVMFVLDTTGSMSCYPSDPTTCATSSTSYSRTDGSTGYYDPEKSKTTDSNGDPMYSKLESLRQAVVLFDSTMRTNADSTTHFRYGFVPYSSSVNVGMAIPSDYLQNTSWTYQSRQVVGDYDYSGNYKLSDGTTAKGDTSITLTGIPKSYCVAQRYPSSGYAQSGPSWSNAGFYMAVNYLNLTWTSASGGTCSGTQHPLRALWRYKPYSLDVSKWVNSYGSSGTAIANPSRLDGLTSKWRGCIEEVNTTAASSFDVNNLPDDLNPDTKPTDATNKWRPMWPDAVWLRSSTSSTDVKDEQVNEASPQAYTDVTYRVGSSYDQGGVANCGAAAQRLSVMTAQQVHDYVYGTDFKAAGGTYHDVGMIWGTRMLSPNGVFGADTTAWPGRNPPSRSIVFMTDGTMAPQQTIDGLYGVEKLDQRVDAGGGSTTDSNNHTARFRIECDAAKQRGITIYVVALGTAVTSDLTYCASPGQVYPASSSTALTAAFVSIAQRVAKLRISK